MTGQEN